MRQDIKDKWLSALRSGEYQQGVGYLHNLSNNSYCCLGVLCEVANISTRGGSNVMLPPGSSYNIGLLTNSMLPDHVEASLASMNDGINAFDGNPQSFSHIADWIENNILVD